MDQGRWRAATPELVQLALGGLDTPLAGRDTCVGGRLGCTARRCVAWQTWQIDARRRRFLFQRRLGGFRRLPLSLRRLEHRLGLSNQRLRWITVLVNRRLGGSELCLRHVIRGLCRLDVGQCGTPEIDEPRLR